MKTVEWLTTNEPKAPLPGPFRFEMSQEAIHHNSMVLKDNDYELDKVISKSPNSLISPGSELRPMNHLELLLGNHPNFPQIKQNLKHGVDYPAEDLPEDLRLSLLQEQLKKGNHKSALTNEAKPIVDKLVHQDVNLGYAIPLSRDCLLKLKGAELYPMGLQHQLTIDDNGNQIPKKRVTHDLSNKRKDGTSINQRVDETKVPGTMYGFALQRFLILVHHIRYHHPNKRILMCKSDFDKAYRRIHTTARIASKCLSAWELPEEKEDNQTQHDRFTALLMTRLPFGSAPAPPEFSIFSEPIFDLACDLMMCPYWDPTKLPSPYASKLEEPIRYKDNTPFGKALEPDVHLPPHQTCGSEGYIDDGALAVLDTEKTHKMVKRAHQALGMASHLVFRPNTKNEPIERPDPQSLRKMNAEGRLREHMIFLGWRIDSREFIISLPDEKVRAWTTSINNTLTKLTINFEDSQTLVGRLNHVGYIIPTARHFLNRIRKLEYLAEKRGHAKINDDTTKDLKLWIELLQRAKAGISINSVIFRRPTTYTISDASEHGVGGYCLRTGKAWRYKFKTHEAAALTLNLKEFIGSIINGMIFLPLDPSPQPCLLSIGDSTSAAANNNRHPRKHNHLDWFSGAIAAQKKGITQQTHDKHSRSWDKWLEFQRECNLSNPYLDNLRLPEKIHILGAFMHANRIGSLSKRRVQISGATARKAVNDVAAAIVASGRPDPTKNRAGKTDIRLTRQTKAYKDKDPPTKHQKALTTEVYRHIMQNAKTKREKARAYLLAGALFYGCRSCEYSKVPRKEQKTRPIRPCDITFKDNHRIIHHNDGDIFTAPTTEIGFSIHKAGKYDDLIPMSTTDDPILSPQKLWAWTIRRLQSYPNYDNQWPIYTFYDEKTHRFSNITSSEILKDIRQAVSDLGRDKLGYGPEEVGTHSNRSSLAMLLYLQRVPPYTIMLIGRWRSDAFLTYIEKQCQEFTKGMSTMMLKIKPNDMNRHETNTPKSRRKKRTEDKYTRNHGCSNTFREAHYTHFGRLNALRSRCRS